MSDKGTVELRLNNTIFKCELDGEFYNLKQTLAYAVQVSAGIMPTGPGQFGLSVESAIICEDCWEKNKDNKGLKLAERSKIVEPTMNDVSKILKK